MDTVEKPHGFARLVRLQMPDQVPFRPLAPDLENFPFGFLNFIFAENARAGGDRLSDNARRMRLADRDELYFLRIAVRLFRRPGDLLAGFGKPLSQSFVHLFNDNKTRFELSRANVYIDYLPLARHAADVAELVDAQVSEACSRKGVEVRFFSSALKEKKG